MKDMKWTQCDSKSDLESRLRVADCKIFPSVISDEADTWGYISVKLDEELLIPIGYLDVGLTPAIDWTDLTVFIGVSETITSIDRASGRKLFEYHMPTVFHGFVVFDAGGFVARDETGFVRLSFDGQVQWEKLFGDIIGNFAVEGDEITGKTMSGIKFRFPIK